MGHNIIPMCSSKQVCNGELPLLHHNCGDYRKPSLTNAICGQNLAWGPPFFIAFLKTTQNFLQVGYLIYPKSMREKYGLNLYLSLKKYMSRDLCSFVCSCMEKLFYLSRLMINIHCIYI